MPVLPKNLAAICNAIVSILRLGEHVRMFYSACDFVVMLRIATNTDHNSDIITAIDSNLVVRTFIFEQKSEYYLSYSDYFGHDGDGYVLCHRYI